MNIELRGLYQRVCMYSPDDPASIFPFSHRLARENDWSIAYARRVVEEYKRFMFLAVATGHEVTPSGEVDQAWHLHLVYTRDYWDEFCSKVLGRPIHHGPTKGGRAEAGRFRDQYEQTLASYQEWFQESPPPDIWPPTESRFAAATESVWVNKATAWIIPKPWPTRLAKRPASWLLGAGIAPLLLGVANPLDFTGPQFLTFYAIVCAIGVVAALILRHLLRHNGPIEEDVRLTPYETACLARGVPGVVQSGVAALVANGQLSVIEAPPAKWGPISFGSSKYRIQSTTASAGPEELERVLTNEAQAVDGVDAGELLESAKPVAESIERDLQGKGLLESPESFRAARWWPTLLLGSIWLFGLMKLLVGLSRDKPIGFLLVGLIILGIVLALFQNRPLRTRAGERLFKRLEDEHQALRNVGPAAENALPASDIILAAGLFGITAIEHPDLWKLQAAIKTVPSSSGGAGCGGGGGGGGCGGCGGCGG